jgi:diadenosine tetraphosphate (Ap4A) HIT family hydrolase
MKKNKLKYIDANERTDFPKAPKGLRYVFFYGGTKNYRGYLVPEDLSRADFMEQYPECVPEQNLPIYENNGIILRADPKFPCPGFYILSLKKTYTAFDLLDDITFLRFSFILKKAKEGMREVLGINYAHLLSNEKSDPYVNVHFWLVPVDGTTSPDLLDFDVKGYLNSFVPQNEINKILDYNYKLKMYFKKINLMGKDNELTEKLQYLK